MGWLDKVRASAAEAGRAAREASEKAMGEASTAWGGEPWMKGARALGEEVVSSSTQLVSEGRKMADEALASAAGTRVGSVVGHRSRQLFGFLGQLPVLSVAVDAMRARHGVDHLYELVRAQPTEPRPYIWLAEAMRRVDEDRRRYIAVRAVIDPTSIVARAALTATTSLGAEQREPTSMRILRNAFVLAVQRLRAGSGDGDTLDVLARVYLFMGDLPEGARFAKLSILAEPENGHRMFTLARAYQALGQSANARRAAELAVTRGCSVGHDILAEMVLSGESLTPQVRIGEYSRLKDLVSTADRQVYWGPSVEGLDILQGLGEAQATRARLILDSIKATVPRTM
jgi:hypothetical protein